ncbi:MAG: hypothetical protein FWF01_01655 [Alphaproteobacteria bacterium]|nr:hypothetical protein [Alphaproteobacteria bacterium]
MEKQRSLVGEFVSAVHNSATAVNQHIPPGSTVDVGRLVRESGLASKGGLCAALALSKTAGVIAVGPVVGTAVVCGAVGGIGYGIYQCWQAYQASAQADAANKTAARTEARLDARLSDLSPEIREWREQEAEIIRQDQEQQQEQQQARNDRIARRVESRADRRGG